MDQKWEDRNPPLVMVKGVGKQLGEKKSMDIRVEGRTPVGRTRKTWLENVEVDMTGL